MIGVLGAVRRARNNVSSIEEAWLLMRIACFAAVLPVLLRYLSIPRLLALHTPKTTPASAHHDRRDKILKYTDYVFRGKHGPYKKTCLKRSLVLYRFMRRSGLDVRICLGIRRMPSGSSDALIGHSWLLHQGKIVFEENPEIAKRHTVVFSYPD